MNKIIGLVGFIGSGKDSAATYLCEKYNFTQDSFASTLKNVCANIFNWPRDMIEGHSAESRAWRDQVDHWWASRLGIENFTPRMALQRIGTDTIRDHFHQDLWILSLENRLNNSNQDFVISDGRFWNELDFLKNNQAVIIEIKRHNYQPWAAVAAQANSGDPSAQEIMKTTYANVHPSEWSWLGYPIDYVVDNSGTIEDLHRSLDELVLELT